MSKAPLSEQELRQALGQYRDHWFAELFTVAVGLAAETHPEEIKKALAGVFDVSALKEMDRRMVKQLQETAAQAQELRHQVEDLKAEVRELTEVVYARAST